MTLKASTTPRKFRFGRHTLSDLNPAATPQQMLDLYAQTLGETHPDLLHCEVSGPVAEGEALIYSFIAQVGKKG